MPNHVIYDRLWDSKKLERCSDGAAAWYPWIFVVADEWGRFEYHPRSIWMCVFRRRPSVTLEDVERWLAEYEGIGLLIRYHVDGELAVWTNFIGKKYSERKPSDLPDPAAFPEVLRRCQELGVKLDGRDKSAVFPRRVRDSSAPPARKKRGASAEVPRKKRGPSAVFPRLEVERERESEPEGEQSSGAGAPDPGPGRVDGDQPPQAATPEEARAVAVAKLGPPPWNHDAWAVWEERFGQGSCTRAVAVRINTLFPPILKANGGWAGVREAWRWYVNRTDVTKVSFLTPEDFVQRFAEWAAASKAGGNGHALARAGPALARAPSSAAERTAAAVEQVKAEAAERRRAGGSG